MSVLHFKARPWTVFDPSNKEHRRWYSQFTKHGTWGRIPVRFVVPDDHGDLVSMIEKKLLAYYSKKEFSLTD